MVPLNFWKWHFNKYWLYENTVWLWTWGNVQPVVESLSEQVLLTLESDKRRGRTIKAAALSALENYQCFLFNMLYFGIMFVMEFWWQICAPTKKWIHLCWELWRIAVRWLTSLLNLRTGPANKVNWTTYIGASPIDVAACGETTISTLIL